MSYRNTSWVMMVSPSMPITSVMWVMRREPSRRRAACTMTSIEAQIISRMVREGSEKPPIVIIDSQRDGSRRITHITEVMGMEGDTIITQDVFLYDMIGEDADGKIIGRHRSTGIGRPRFWERARYFGEEKRLAAALDAAEVAETN